MASICADGCQSMIRLCLLVIWCSGVLLVKVLISAKAWLKAMTCHGCKYCTEIASGLIKVGFEGQDSMV